jgi:hypothetical protein
MDRKEFLRGCATGLCACAAACLPTGALSEPAKTDDWRLPFVKQRYAKLISMLSERMNAETLAATMQDLGAFCAAQRDKEVEPFRGKPGAYIAQATKQGLVVTHDAAANSYTSTFDPHGDCFCPLNSLAAKTPGAVCDCSVGWTKHTWGILLGKEPKVALKESVLRGGKVCKFEITAA